MPQHKSFKKSLKTDAVRRDRNRAALSTLRLRIRQYLALSTEEKANAYNGLQSILDKAINKGIVTPNRAARLKSRLIPSG